MDDLELAVVESGDTVGLHAGVEIDAHMGMFAGLEREIVLGDAERLGSLEGEVGGQGATAGHLQCLANRHHGDAFLP